MDTLIALACLLLSLQLSTLCIFIWFWTFYVTMQDAINSASTVTQTLGGELLEGQRKLLSLAAAGANPSAVNPLVSQLSNGPLGALHEKVCTVFLILCWFFKPIMWRSICGYQMFFFFLFFVFLYKFWLAILTRSTLNMCIRLRCLIQQRSYQDWYLSTNMRRPSLLPYKEVMCLLYPGYVLRWAI